MILYAFEFLMLFAFVLATFFVFRFLVNSPTFSRFVEGSKPCGEIEVEASEDAKDAAQQVAQEIRKRRTARRVAEPLD